MAVLFAIANSRKAFWGLVSAAAESFVGLGLHWKMPNELGAIGISYQLVSNNRLELSIAAQ